jgi:hypothetical protein
VEVVVIAVEDRRDPPDVHAFPPREEELHLGMTEERVLEREDPGEIASDRRDPVRIAGVDPIRDIEEAREFPATAPDPLESDGVVGHPSSVSA